MAWREWTSFICWEGKNWRCLGTDILRDRERANQYVRLLFSKETMGAYAIRPYPDGRKGGVFFVRCRSEMGWIGGDRLLLSIDIVWKGIRGLRDVGRDRK